MCRYSFSLTPNPYEPLLTLPSDLSFSTFPEVNTCSTRKRRRGPKHRCSRRPDEKFKKQRILKTSAAPACDTFVAARLPNLDPSFDVLSANTNCIVLNGECPPSTINITEHPWLTFNSSAINMLDLPRLTCNPPNHPIFPYYPPGHSGFKRGLFELATPSNLRVKDKDQEESDGSVMIEQGDAEEAILIEHDAELYSWIVLAPEDIDGDSDDGTYGHVNSPSPSISASVEDLGIPGSTAAAGFEGYPVQSQQLHARRALAEDDAAYIELPGSEWGSEDESYVVPAASGSPWSMD